MTETPRNGEYDDWLDSIEDGEGYYVECDEGHGWLPPRRVCPDCGSRELHDEPLPDSGEIVTHTTITVATPQFEDDAPYVTAIADFGPVSITGLVRGVDPEDVSMADVVGIEVGERETTGERAVVFRPR
ncbi:Zn-ribbon domain-containing OB-fold protein [Haloarcula salinisoli]|uniref:OB-fold domain-containing protein n=1 Tax=Haloarcula salinisoli TaxID=2487746 RepID=A0A8J8C743_9EURY|nr:OB-fold domain-containing protein [Halomicroarcula salinisoli]MBX0285604.1 OB-fold domain-containing protein [Halomicroarcula salinisoli]MBX0302907.1 OB-fold domain-containing protein [Halomicroarcula salinisoli]